MDKFGIFKLLNSFFNLCGQNSASQNGNAEQVQNGENFLNNLSGLFGNGNTATDKPTENKPANNPVASKKQAPLQSNMISVMQSHDAFVNRVKNKHPQK